MDGVCFSATSYANDVIGYCNLLPHSVLITNGKLFFFEYRHDFVLFDRELRFMR